MRLPAAGVLLLAAVVSAVVVHAQDPAPPAAAPGADPVYPINTARVVPPKKIKNVSPQYTAEAMRARIQGRVRLRGIIEKDGTVSTVEVLQSLERTLDEQAVNAVKQWQFEPATLDGNPVRVVMTIEMAFTIRTPPEIWPDGGNSATAIAAGTREVVEAPRLRLIVMRPENWSSQPVERESEWLGLVAQNMPATISIRLPESTTLQLQWPASPATVQQLAETARYSQRAANAAITSTGQVRSQAGAFWVWSTVRVPPPESTAANLSPLAERRVWRFTTTIDNRMVVVSCNLLIPRELDYAAADALVRQATSEFGAVVNGLAFEVTPG